MEVEKKTSEEKMDGDVEDNAASVEETEKEWATSETAKNALKEMGEELAEEWEKGYAARFTRRQWSFLRKEDLLEKDWDIRKRQRDGKLQMARTAKSALRSMCEKNYSNWKAENRDKYKERSEDGLWFTFLNRKLRSKDYASWLFNLVYFEADQPLKNLLDSSRRKQGKKESEAEPEKEEPSPPQWYSFILHDQISSPISTLQQYMKMLKKEAKKHAEADFSDTGSLNSEQRRARSQTSEIHAFGNMEDAGGSSMKKKRKAAFAELEGDTEGSLRLKRLERCTQNLYEMSKALQAGKQLPPRSQASGLEVDVSRLLEGPPEPPIQSLNGSSSGADSGEELRKLRAMLDQEREKREILEILLSKAEKMLKAEKLKREEFEEQVESALTSTHELIATMFKRISSSATNNGAIPVIEPAEEDTLVRNNEPVLADPSEPSEN